ncbi:MAG: hypothetical protein SV375_00385, partial [Thermodesulfobacteriota bacterium]|nr:hypothetical protein [Thermodesulfobacteriota bacterium]
KKLDIPRKQIFIEALILDVSPNEQFNFGTEWQGFRDVGHPLTNQSRAGVITGSKLSGGPLDSLLGIGADGALMLGSGFSLGMLGESISVGDFVFPSLGILVNAVNSLSTVDILSRPQLMTLNNEKAVINISTNLPFETTETILEGGGTSQNIDYRDVGIILEIIPHINKAGKVRLEISLEQGTFSGTATTDRPVTLKRTIDTVVEINNGHTIVIGGLIQKQSDFSRGAVPCLGGLPLVGWAFKSIGITETKTNLLVFINPRVMKGIKDTDLISEEKKEYIENERRLLRQEVEGEKPFFMEYDPLLKQQKEEETAE